MKIRVFVGVGSNLEDPLAQVESAFRALSGLPGTTLRRRSPLYWNKAVAPEPQPDFVNGAAELVTSLDPYALLDALEQIEAAQGRVRGAGRWGPRVIDLDILLYGDEEIRDHRLTVPHPEMHRRRFVLRPLSDIAPDLEIPGHGRLEQVLRRAPHHEMIRIGAPASVLKTG